MAFSTGNLRHDIFLNRIEKRSIYRECLSSEDIRLVELVPGQYGDPILCELFKEKLTGELKYKALSYAWGSPKAVEPIYLAGRQYFVTRNLDSALRRLRDRHRAVILWVDALCINQADDNERTAQVRIMREIYTGAEETAIYFGEVEFQPRQTHWSICGTVGDLSVVTVPITSAKFLSGNGDAGYLEVFRNRCVSPQTRNFSPTAFDVFCLLRSLVGTSDLTRIAPFNQESLPNIHGTYQRHLFKSLSQMMDCQWFGRIWTVQEIVVPKNIMVLYGSSMAPWDMLVEAAKAFSKHRDSLLLTSFPHEYTEVLDLFSQRVLDIAEMRESWSNGGNISLLQLLRRFGSRGATDDRDKVYALLGLTLNPGVDPDYQLDVPTVFENTAVAIIKKEGSLEILAGDIGRKNHRDLPSWVPDWTDRDNDFSRRLADIICNYRASLKSSIFLSSNWGRGRSSGILEYLDRLWLEREQKNGSTAGLRVEWNRTKCTDILGTSEWMTFLRGHERQDREPSPEECLEAVEVFCSSQGEPVCLHDYGSGILKLPGCRLGTISDTGEVRYSGGYTSSVVRSWAILAAKYLHRLDRKIYKERLGFEFVRTICADMMYVKKPTGVQRRRIKKDDLGVIAAQYLTGNGSYEDREFQKALNSLFEETNPLSRSSQPLEDIDIENAVRAATDRRKFFITKEGHMGLGPAGMRLGDYLYILPGARTPFILRDLSSPSDGGMIGEPLFLKRCFFEVVGDCYAHGWMDGKAMSLWRRAWAGERKWEELLDQWLTCPDIGKEIRNGGWEWFKQLKLSQDPRFLLKNEQARKEYFGTLGGDGIVAHNVYLV